MTSKYLGLIEKYHVERADGKPVKWCFVLEDTDPLAKAAILAYADLAEGAGYTDLASDLRLKVGGEWPRQRERWEIPETDVEAEAQWQRQIDLARGAQG